MKERLKKLLYPFFYCFKQLFQVRAVVFTVAYFRYVYFVRLRRRLRQLERPQNAAQNTISHNLRGIRYSLACERPLSLIRPLASIEAVGPVARARLLAIGPRSEAELLSLWGHGFSLSRIKAIDLISYSPWIDLGDMHRIPYPDSSFDILLCVSTLAYSEDRRLAAREFVRVVRPGGLIACSDEHQARTNDETVAQLGYLPGTSDRIGSLDGLLACFEGNIDKIYFQHDLKPGQIPEWRSVWCSILAIFSIKKPGEAGAHAG